ncbi:helix-turn-helix domain-containing protein [Neorhizobium petrolearium]|uniref:Helix-turn-helix domain-containing protein n=1 Tax=Neorhizobium petrolearium TaxID=515361 RepID=A0ABY8LZK3_9HYPH|nr:helix-turn-helix domain-containing protein [Neorhizobium petrolearium]MCC2612627.1 helix-turn-helix domain-containing protein [Neorhizobium petrolearium]WGI67750.1 helix-turn-helix domain-containing protein [Neorhizobium petrolearium]
MSDDGDDDDLFSGSEMLSGDGLGPWPILIKNGEEINIKQACHLTGKTDKTIRKWCKWYGIGGAMHGAPIRISAPGLWMVFHGDPAALELLRAGKRNHPRVLRYFNDVGVQE